MFLLVISNLRWFAIPAFGFIKKGTVFFSPATKLLRKARCIHLVARSLIVDAVCLQSVHKTPIILSDKRGMSNPKVPTLLSLTILCILVPFAFSEPSEEVKGQIRYGIRAAKQDHWDEAIYRWRKALQLDPNNLMAHNNLAVAYEQMGEYELAMEEYQIAYRLDSQNQIVKNNLERFRDFFRKYQRQKR